jgi:lambda repressor-like predicted transcriptional regulator
MKSVIDWSAKPEPWRTIGRQFVRDLMAIKGGAHPAPPRDIDPHARFGAAVTMVKPTEDADGARLRQARFAQRLTIKQLSRRAGVAQVVVSHAERGIPVLGRSRLAIARALRVDPATIWHPV